MKFVFIIHLLLSPSTIIILGFFPSPPPLLPYENTQLDNYKGTQKTEAQRG